MRHLKATAERLQFLVVQLGQVAHQLERLPVLADHQSQRLVGIVSRSDLVKPLQAQQDEEDIRERLLAWRRHAS